MSSTSKSKKFIPKPKPQCGLKEQKRNWLELPSDVTANILRRIGAIDILENVQKVCTGWCKICKDPAMWRVIKMENKCSDLLDKKARHRLQEMCKKAVDLSKGQLVDITMVDFANDELLEYVADRSRKLRRIEIACTRSGTSGIHDTWTTSFRELPLLEELNLYSTRFSDESVAFLGLCCPKIRTLKLNKEADRHCPQVLTVINGIPLAIGEYLPGLRHLELIGMTIPNYELNEILKGCKHLESLDLRKCLKFNIDGPGMKSHLEKIKSVKLPNDSIEGCPYIYKNGVASTEPQDSDPVADLARLHALGAFDDDDDDDDDDNDDAPAAAADAADDVDFALLYALGSWKLRL